MDLDHGMMRAVVDTLDDGVYFVDRDRRITFWSRGAERITGYTAAEVVGRHCSDNILCHIDDDGRQLCHDGCPLERSIAEGTDAQAQLHLHHKQGHRVPIDVRIVPLRDPSGKIIGGVETFADRTQRMVELEQLEQLEAMAFLDPLTELANRRYLWRALESRFGEFDRLGATFGVIIADIDHFKQFNDTWGHDVGDQVLKTVAHTLRQACRCYDVAGRWGGEEFLIIAANAHGGSLATVAQRCRSLVEQSMVHHEGQDLRVTMSLGATVVTPEDDATSLIARADELLYRSKQQGRNRVNLAA